MGAWSHQPFGNDTACDWAYSLLDSSDLAVIESALDKALAVGGEYLEAPDAEEAIAAIEVLAKLRGKGTQNDSYTEEIDGWVEKVGITPSPLLLKKAKTVIERILARDSELLELWKEAEDSNEWQQSIGKLVVALDA
jgi:hypothetical protein